MADAVPEPRVVEYCRITGVPAEFNDYLPPDCTEHKKWVAAKAAGLESGMEGLGVGGGGGEGGGGAKLAEEPEKKLPGGKTKKKSVPEVVIERNVRNKKKCITTVRGLDVFGVKLGEASKLFGKKFASGASVVKNASGKEEIDIQGDCLDKLPDFILKSFKDSSITKAEIFFMDGKSKKPFYGGEEAEAE